MAFLGVFALASCEQYDLDERMPEWLGSSIYDYLQEEGYDTVDANLHLGFKADERDYGVGAQILRSLGVSKMRLITNNPVKRIGLESYGLEVTENIPLEIKPNQFNEFYLETKRNKMGHLLKNIK